MMMGTLMTTETPTMTLRRKWYAVCVTRRVIIPYVWTATHDAHTHTDILYTHHDIKLSYISPLLLLFRIPILSLHRINT